MKLVKYSFALSEKCDPFPWESGTTPNIFCMKDFKVLRQMVDNFNIFHLHTKRTSIAVDKKKQTTFMFYVFFSFALPSSLFRIVSKCSTMKHSCIFEM